MRTCDGCGKEASTLDAGVDFHGNCFGFFGPCCREEVGGLRDKLAANHGAYIVAGVYQCSPKGSPAVRNLEHLRTLVAEEKKV